ncbi:MAG: anhydro-N-acetylmuramic acid kinase [Cyanophyceae cyanobacterium]
MKIVGLISGTSVDGIDAALVKVTGAETDLAVELLAGDTFPYPADLREQILAVCGGASLAMAQLAQLDEAIADSFARTAQEISAGVGATLIGSHGQTVFHRAPRATLAQGKEGKGLQSTSSLGYSLQLGRGEVIAHLTGIPTVSNFRAADIAAGGQGAPLVSKVDACVLSHPKRRRCIQNLGGIGNVTYLPAREPENWEQQIAGWDTGPGNALIDLAVQELTQGRETYDRDGNWAAQGEPCQELVERWLDQDYFRQPPPKSTGRELFGEAYLQQCWQDAAAYQLSSSDWLATLTELTVASVVQSYRTFLPQLPDEILLCGGGSRNLYLKQRLQSRLSEAAVMTTDAAGLNEDYKEAIAFAVLAYWRHQSIPGNLPLVTGARQPMLLGDIHWPIV